MWDVDKQIKNRKKGLRTVHPEKKYTIKVEGGRHHLESTMDLVQFVTMEYGVEESQADIIASAVGEACQNAVHYSFQDVDQVTFNLEIQLGEQVCTAVVINQGPEFEFDAITPFQKDQDFMLYGQGGMGIPMMKKLMDTVSYERQSGDRNVITLVKYFNSKTSGKGEEYHEN